MKLALAFALAITGGGFVGFWIGYLIGECDGTERRKLESWDR